jgi:hypothetical protein
MDEATTPSVAKNMACRSRGMTWVETGSGLRPSFPGDIFFDKGIDIGEGADRARNGAGGDLLARCNQPGAAAGKFGIGLRQLDAEGGRFGVNAVLRPMVTVSLCSNARFLDGGQHASTSAISRSEARLNCTARQVSSTSDEVMP